MKPHFRRFLPLVGVGLALALMLSFVAPARAVATPAGDPLATPYEVNLWEMSEAATGPKAVKAPLDPAEYATDPLSFL